MSIYSLHEFDACAAALTGGTTLDQWESRVAKVGGKVFATLGALDTEKPHVVVKVDPGEFDFLTTLPGVTQARYFAKGHWVAIHAGSAMPDDEIRSCIADSWALVAAGLTRKVRAELGIVLPKDATAKTNASVSAVE